MTVFAPGQPRSLHPADKVARHRELGWWTDETVDGLLRGHLAERGDVLAVLDPPDKQALCGLEPLRLTWSRLDSAVDRVAAALLRAGVRVGDVVGLQLPNTVELVVSYLAVIRIGAIVSPLAVQFRDHEIGTAARVAGFDAFISTARIGDRAAVADAAAVLAELGRVRAVLGFGSGLPEGVSSLELGEASEADRVLVAEHLTGYRADPGHCITICWTSGTESIPKAVPRAHYEWMAIARVTQEAPGLTEDDVILNPFPLVNMASIGGTLLPWLRSGARLVLHQPFTLPTYLEQIARERVTYTLAPPAVLTMLLQNEAILERADLSSVRTIASGSAPLAPSMVRGWQERHGIGIINMFGSNEGVCLLSAPTDVPDPEQRARFFPRYGTPGVQWSCRAMDPVSLRLVDLETGEEITGPGRPGELRIGGPTVFSGYLAGTTDADPFDERGDLCTGDVFEITGENDEFLLYVDRAKDLIIRGGMNIAPVEIENLIIRHPAVAEVAVIGYPDEVLGEKSCAVVVPAPGAEVTGEEIVAHLREQKIASYKLPEKVVFADALPRNPVGKALKRVLRDRLRDGALKES
ncbi:class I adenylate-forming enzyme family protein [Actinocorallia sp. B10E7]|uniref:class I adenylate-forming enzyme family protein n=1 Tax=Actinocorallia sp. B10E7 TaxID=3153558 RepID=UPI00325E41DC